MPTPHTILIHEFEASGIPPQYDDFGDEMIGFYYQFTDVNDKLISGLFGPYRYTEAAEQAARRAFHARDF